MTLLMRPLLGEGQRPVLKILACPGNNLPFAHWRQPDLVGRTMFSQHAVKGRSLKKSRELLAKPSLRPNCVRYRGTKSCHPSRVGKRIINA